MGRRSKRCPRSAAAALTADVEFNLTQWGGGLTGVDLYDTAAQWDRFGSVILDQWLKFCPGLRPWGAVIAGEAPVPPLLLDAVPFLWLEDKPLGADVGWHGTDRQLARFWRSEGVVSAAEFAEFEKLSRQASCIACRYEFLSRPAAVPTLAASNDTN